MSNHQIPPLPYAYDALEPYIDTKTMQVHHTGHHQGYVDNLNKALTGSEVASWPLEQLIRKLDQVPEAIRTQVRNHGGGHLNHSLFWPMLTPNAPANPQGELAQALNTTFGSFQSFREKFTAASLGLFGSGWSWLVLTPNKSLEITTTPNQDNPITNNLTPILGLDLWEHAYYLKHQNRRADYIQAFFHVINWPHINQLYKQALS